MIDPTRVKARELMRTEVVTLAPDDTIETALAVFEESGISGAPVVADGRLVGVITLADVSRTEHLRGDQIETHRDYDFSEPVGEERTDELDPEEVFRKEDYSAEVLGRELVKDWMTNRVVALSPTASLARVCTVMQEEHIHRVFVTEEGRLVGVISSFDVVRHVARTAKEPAKSTGVKRP